MQHAYVIYTVANPEHHGGGGLRKLLKLKSFLFSHVPENLPKFVMGELLKFSKLVIYSGKKMLSFTILFIFL